MKPRNCLFLLLALLAVAACAGSGTVPPAQRSVADDDNDVVSPDDDDDAAVWTDPSTGHMWQADAPATAYYPPDAKNYCAGLTLAGFHDWRLPDIDALRSLIRGCPDTATGGSCGVTDQCLNQSCENDACSADNCPAGGPGPFGCFWPQIGGRCPDLYWSSSAVTGSADLVWGVDFSYGSVYGGYVVDATNVRCVR
jgi:hypothetical protein